MMLLTPLARCLFFLLAGLSKYSKDGEEWLEGLQRTSDAWISFPTTKRLFQTNKTGTWEFIFARAASSPRKVSCLQFPQGRNCQGRREAPFFVPCSNLYCLGQHYVVSMCWHDTWVARELCDPLSPLFFFFCPINRWFLATLPTDTKPCLWSLIKTLAEFYINWNLHSTVTIATITQN